MTPRSCLAESVTVEAPNSADAGSLCAYSRTRRRFLCADVEAGDFSNSSLDVRLLGLGPDSAGGLWLNPFWGIPPTSLSVPVDLIYLDQDCVVLDVVESFPLSQVSASTPPPASVLVLPADSVTSTDTQIGDRLVICLPGEMKRRLRDFSGADLKAQPYQADSPADESSERTNTARVLSWEGHAAVKSIQEEVSTESRPTESGPANQRPTNQLLLISISESRESARSTDASEVQQTQAGESASSSGTENTFELFKSFMPATAESTPAKSWLKRIFAPGAAEQRGSSRESINGLVAHFFTGGFPIPHEVHDISATGAYVYTQERWYPGTVVRVTLTDSRNSGSELSITLNSSVVRTGADGVGLQFLFDLPRNCAQQVGGAVIGAGKQHVKRFIKRLREVPSDSQKGTAKDEQVFPVPPSLANRDLHWLHE
jgi:PilZ domain